MTKQKKPFDEDYWYDRMKRFETWLKSEETVFGMSEQRREIFEAVRNKFDYFMESFDE